MQIKVSGQVIQTQNKQYEECFTLRIAYKSVQI